MNDDIRIALGRLSAAYDALARICELPTENGARVRWTNGVIWERVGQDAWQPVNNGDPAGETWPSAHIASSGAWALVVDEPDQPQQPEWWEVEGGIGGMRIAYDLPSREAAQKFADDFARRMSRMPVPATPTRVKRQSRRYGTAATA